MLMGGWALVAGKAGGQGCMCVRRRMENGVMVPMVVLVGALNLIYFNRIQRTYIAFTRLLAKLGSMMARSCSAQDTFISSCYIRTMKHEKYTHSCRLLFRSFGVYEVRVLWILNLRWLFYANVAGAARRHRCLQGASYVIQGVGGMELKRNNAEMGATGCMVCVWVYVCVLVGKLCE